MPNKTDLLIGTLEALKPAASSPELSERAYRQAVEDCVVIIRSQKIGELKDELPLSLRKDFEQHLYETDSPKLDRGEKALIDCFIDFLNERQDG